MVGNISYLIIFFSVLDLSYQSDVYLTELFCYSTKATFLIRISDLFYYKYEDNIRQELKGDIA